MNILPSLRRIKMFKSSVTLFSVLLMTTVFNLIGYSSDAGAITTTVVCNTATSCTTASSNLNAATLRRPDNDALGIDHHAERSYLARRACVARDPGSVHAERGRYHRD